MSKRPGQCRRPDHCPGHRAVAAKRLAEAGMQVVVLEQGDWPDYTRARADHADFELTAGRDWSANPNRRQAPADYPISDVDSDIAAVMYNAVGGSTVLFAAHWQRYMPSDFRVRTLDGVADDWPLTYEELEPYYEQVESDFGVSGLAGDPAFPPVRPPAASPLAPWGAWPGHNRLGWHWWPAPNALPPGLQIAPPLYPAGDLHVGLRRGRQGSVDRTTGPRTWRWASTRTQRPFAGSSQRQRPRDARCTWTARGRTSAGRRAILAPTVSAPAPCCRLRVATPTAWRTRLARRPGADDAPLRYGRWPLRRGSRARVACGDSISTRSSSMRRTRRAASCAGPSGACSQLAARYR